MCSYIQFRKSIYIDDGKTYDMLVHGYYHTYVKTQHIQWRYFGRRRCSSNELLLSPDTYFLEALQLPNSLNED